MLDLERSQIAEALREQTALLRTLVHQTAPLDLSHLSAAEKQTAMQIKLTQVSLKDCIETMAELHGLDTERFIKDVLLTKPHPLTGNAFGDAQ